MSNTQQPKIELVEINTIKPWPSNARKHPQGKLKSLIKAIQQDDLIDPIILDEHNQILSGHLRVEAFKVLDIGQIPAIKVDHLSLEQKRAYVIAANRFPERGSWDQKVLQVEFSDLSDISCDLDLSTTGFDIPEIDVILSAENFDEEEPAVPGPPTVPVSRLGDLWILGDHQLVCGDCRAPEVWKRLMGKSKARMSISDPPYNVRISGHVSSKDHTEFEMASGEMTSADFEKFLNDAVNLVAKNSMDGSIHYIFMDHRHLRELYGACDAVFSKQLNLAVWVKTNAGMGSFLRSQHELIAIYNVGSNPHVNNVQLGRFGRNRSNVWPYAGANTFRRDRDQDLKDHPTVKPTKMIADAILDASNIGDIVIDGFGGSGTLILAAEKTRRCARVIEIDGKYVDVSIRRWEELTGKKAIHADTGKTFKVMKEERDVKLIAPPIQEVAS